MLSTNNIISSIEENLEKSINLQQQQLDNIKNSFSKAQNFLLENDYSELNEEDDIIMEVMKCLKRIKEQISSNEKDIKSIKESVKSLESLSNTIDKSITKQLEDKIEFIKENNDNYSSKIKESKNFLDVLLSLEIVCPACNGNAKTNGRCSYCDNIGVVDISKILEKEKILDIDLIKNEKISISDEVFNNQFINQNYIENTIEDNKSKSEHQFVISRTK